MEEAENAVEEVEAIDDVKPGEMVTGCVTDEKNMPLMMVNIFEKDEFGRIVAHAVSDLNGDFAFKLVNPQHKLTVSCPGFATQTLDIKDKEVNVTLKHNAKLDGATVYTAANAIREENSHPTLLWTFLEYSAKKYINPTICTSSIGKKLILKPYIFTLHGFL